MHRRRYLSLAAAVGLTGCVGAENEGDPTPTPTATPTPSRTESQTPRVVNAKLVPEWESPGDLEARGVDSLPAGETVGIAFEWYQTVHDGTLAVFEQVEVYDGQERVANEVQESEQIYDESGYRLWEHAMGFDSRTWNGPGTYEALIRVRDNVINEVSDAYEYEFELE